MIANAFEATGLFEVVEVKAAIGQVHLMGRVVAKSEGLFLERVVEPVLDVMEKTCEGFIGKQYFRKRGQTRFGWVISFASTELRGAAYEICKAIAHLSTKKEIEEVPLVGPGAPQSGGSRSGKKGASPCR
jgi:hypothetical protein